MAEEKIPVNITHNNPQIGLGVQLIYANGTGITMSQSDIQVVFTANGRPTISIAMSMSTAKSLQSGIERALKNYEQKTDTKVLDLTELGELLKKP